ncbi:MAG: ABC transporter ATP-binding protein [Gaiellales bacterium]
MSPINTEAQPKAMIRLEGVTKRYRGVEIPAVDNLSLDILEGEICMLIGPSGCGKTTTMKMINRLIEPSGGSIHVDGEDVTNVDADLLRRRIGYVIQQIGLFPHQTIRQNIATVPHLLKWDKARTNARVDELLETVGMDPALYRDRYPKELSGGQRQRIGVARAMAADPPVLLMDEPFGAIDPITRDHLQNEFLRLQEDIQKTIVFVTHDIDEAIKMGDRICILREGGIIAQYDTPENILTNPANEFVADFIGSGATMKRLNLMRVGEVKLAQITTCREGDARADVLTAARAADVDWALMLDSDGRPVRWVSRRELRSGSQQLSVSEGTPVADEDSIDRTATLQDALERVLEATSGFALVNDRAGRYAGVIDIALVTGVIEDLQAESRERRRLEDAE